MERPAFRQRLTSSARQGVFEAEKTPRRIKGPKGCLNEINIGDQNTL